MAKNNTTNLSVFFFFFYRKESFFTKNLKFKCEELKPLLTLRVLFSFTNYCTHVVMDRCETGSYVHTGVRRSGPLPQISIAGPPTSRRDNTLILDLGGGADLSYSVCTLNG